MPFIAGPVNGLTDFQVEYGGFLMGPGTNYGVPPTWSFFDMAPIKTMDTQKQWQSGSWSGPDFADVLLPGFDVEVWAYDDAAFAAAILDFRQAIAPGLVAPLWVKVPRFDPIGILAKPSRRSNPIDLSWGQLSLATIEFRCPDPTWQSVTRSLALAASGAAASGLVAPLGATAGGGTGVLDAGSSVAAPYTGVVTNVGNAPCWPVVTVTGPVTGPFTITVDGNPVTYSGNLLAGQSLKIDYGLGTAVLNDGTDRTTLLTQRAFSAIPAASWQVNGSSTVTFVASGGTAAVQYADQWR